MRSLFTNHLVFAIITFRALRESNYNHTKKCIFAIARMLWESKGWYNVLKSKKPTAW